MPATVTEAEWCSPYEASRTLGLGRARFHWLIANGHLRMAISPNGWQGVTRESVNEEAAWRASATTAQRVRRVLRYLIRWSP